MTLRKKRDTTGGSQPGLTPIDDIHGNNSVTDLDPDNLTGRLPAQDDDDTDVNQENRKKTPLKSSAGRA